MVLESADDFPYRHLPALPTDFANATATDDVKQQLQQQDGAETVKTSRAGTAVGYTLILLQVFGLVVSAEITQKMETHGFNQPIWIVFLNHR